MYTEGQKLHLIEEVLRTNDPAILAELESVLSKGKVNMTKKQFSAHELSGKWSKDDAALIEKAIKEGCEQINEDDWK
jgi:hypothetical protein